MNELALFAGAGGGLLGTKLLGWDTVCAVEIDAFCRSVLLARQRDGYLDRFPIWDDIRTFDGKPWRNKIDVVTGGFPCQPFSTASRGRKRAADLWPEMLRIVGEVRPRYVLAENVSYEPIVQALGDLARFGFDGHIVDGRASAVGAPHERRRWWLVAHADCDSQPRLTIDAKMAGIRRLPGLAWWKEDISGTLGMDDGAPHRMDRLRALGNAQVPAVVRDVWRLVQG